MDNRNSRSYAKSRGRRFDKEKRFLFILKIYIHDIYVIASLLRVETITISSTSPARLKTIK